MPKILVTDAGRGSAIAVIRSLGRKGYRVIAADSDAASPGFHSRYVQQRLVYPFPEQSPKQFCECLLDLVKSEGVDLIVPVTDLTLQPISKARDRFEKFTRLAIPPSTMLEVVMDKTKTVELAKKVGVPVPKTFVVATVEEALKKAEALNWPLVLKPQSSRQLRADEAIDSFKVTYAGSNSELRGLMKHYEGHCSVLLQEYVSGIGYGVELLMHEGEPLAVFEHKRLREIPITGGASAYRESVKLDPNLFDYSMRLLKELKWTGLAMVEFKVNGSNVVLMEINGRVWGSLPLAVASGVDFPALLAELYFHGAENLSPMLNNNYRVGLRCRDLQKDLMWVVSVLIGKKRHSFQTLPSRKYAALALLGMLNPRRKFDLLCLEDPWPGFAEFPKIVKKFRTKVKEANG